MLDGPLERSFVRHRSSVPVSSRSALRHTLRRPLLVGAGALAAVAAVSGGIAVSSPGGSFAAPAQAAAAFEVPAATALTEQASAAQQAEVTDRVRARVAAGQRRERIAAATHQAAAADAARVRADRVRADRVRAGRVSRDRQRAELIASNPRSAARAMAAARGWGGSQFSCLESLWTKESGWKHTADNPSSSAYGIPQALPGSKMASAGSDWRTNPVTQIRWGLGYIAGSYGTPCSAWRHSQANNWY